ncbi:MAG: hypothetical protein JNM80_05425 [Phycisphaerae bacterium]|nr:hypothetical protein [Phycisphaerae bacterium]
MKTNSRYVTPGIASLLLAAGVAAPALAQSNVDPTNKNSWSENCGWMNWRDANGTTQGVRYYVTFLGGFAWGENIGWVNMGDGTPGGPNGTAYTNSSGTDFGVNVGVGGNLNGFAWGENVGWINFGGGALATPPQPARYDAAAGRFRGYAWGENIGWINLDDAGAVKFVAVSCYANCDQSTIAPVLNVNDFTCFLNRFAANDPYANCDGSTTPPILNVNDFTCFLNKFAAGCT